MALEIKSFEASLNSFKKKKKDIPGLEWKFLKSREKEKISIYAGRKEIPIAKISHDF